MMDLHARPLLVYWEVTQACDLACAHCRADAQPLPHPSELTGPEALGVLDRLAEFGAPLPHVVFTGGDPLKRADLFGLIARARALGFPVAVSPSGTPALTRDMIRRLKAAGVWMISLSVDGSSAWRHDEMRGIPGTFERTVEAAGWAREAGLPVQINTLVCEQTIDDLPAIHDLAARLGADRWSLFFLIEVGRGKRLTSVDSERAERTLRWVAQISEASPLDIKTTEAPMYRRIKLQRADPKAAPRGGGIRDGCGVMFISHAGQIYPSGFLPLSAGNVRLDDPVRVYRESRLFRDLRHPVLFKGRCGACEYSHVCGGSRARAFAATGDPFESDPLCSFEPRRLQAREGRPSGRAPR